MPPACVCGPRLTTRAADHPADSRSGAAKASLAGPADFASLGGEPEATQVQNNGRKMRLCSARSGEPPMTRQYPRRRGIRAVGRAVGATAPITIAVAGWDLGPWTRQTAAGMLSRWQTRARRSAGWTAPWPCASPSTPAWITAATTAAPSRRHTGTRRHTPSEGPRRNWSST